MAASDSLSRRRFLVQSGAAASVAFLSSSAAKAFAASPGAQPIQFGYSQITWGDDLEAALRDISATGYNGVQLIVKNLQASYMDKPAQVKAMVAQHGLTGVALSSGRVMLEPELRAAQLELHMSHAKYAHDAGILYLQLVADRDKSRPPLPDDYKRSGELMTEIGRRASDLGLQASLHNHMGSLGQAPEQVDLLMANSDPRYLKLELDIAHYVSGGGDPVKAIDTYHDRLLFLHAKDVLARRTKNLSAPQSGNGKVPKQSRNAPFVELGNGIVDIPAVFNALARYKFKGWVVVELDKEEVDPSRTPKESAEISKRYIESTLKLHV